MKTKKKKTKATSVHYTVTLKFKQICRCRYSSPHFNTKCTLLWNANQLMYPSQYSVQQCYLITTLTQPVILLIVIQPVFCTCYNLVLSSAHHTFHDRAIVSGYIKTNSHNESFYGFFLATTWLKFEKGKKKNLNPQAFRDMS